MIQLDILTIEDKRYPTQLKEIKDPPQQLYIEGNIELLKTNILSIIGSRLCSENGMKLTQKFSKELVYQGMTIASGMAVGIDTIAHQTVLEENGKTIAILGSGFNHIFPEENKTLYEKIIKNKGLVITEYPPEVKAKSNHFLARNRIVSGLSLGILVIEAKHRSGTSVTAKLAKQQGKKVFALPHEVDDKHGIGTNRLIREGAKIVTCTKDILKEFPFLVYQTLPKKEKQNILNKRKECKNKEYQEIYQLITEEPISIDEIVRKCHYNLKEINHIILMLELEELIEKVQGGYQCILDKK